MPDTPDRDAIRRRWEAPTPDYGVRMSKMAPSQYAATQALADDLMQARKDIAALLAGADQAVPVLMEAWWVMHEICQGSLCCPSGCLADKIMLALAALGNTEPLLPLTEEDV